MRPAVPSAAASVLAASALAVGAAAFLLGDRGTAAAQEERRPPAAPLRVTIVHTNDLHGHVESFPAVAQVVRDVRKADRHALFLDAGDCITGTHLSTVFEGSPVFDLMNSLGYDAGTIGNHEFDHGWRRIHDFREVAGHPLVCANARDPDGKAFGDAEWTLLDAGGVRVGVIGLLTEHVPTLTTAKASAGCRFESPLAAAKRLVPEVRKAADVVVLLTHVGVEADGALAGAVPGIDLIVGGHTHTKLEKAIVVNGTRIVQAWKYGQAVGVVELDLDPATRRVADVRSRLVPVDAETSPRAADVEAAVLRWMKRLDEEDPGGAEVIGRARRDLTERQLRPILERILRETLGADLRYQNAAGVRGRIAEGDIRVRDLVTVLPFDNALGRMRFRGSQLPEWARKALGDRFVAGEEYVVATNEFVADQQKKYFGTTGVPFEDAGVPLRDAVVAWVRRHGGFEPAEPARPGKDDGKR